MKRLSVWAPLAESVAAVTRNGTEPMQRHEYGWWATEKKYPAGADYAFSVDGGPPLPDPRSPQQPDGIHGFSRVLDHGAYEWGDAGWQPRPLASAVIYEMHVGTFTPEGTFAAAKNQLGYLAELGITHLELMPVNQFSGRRGWGYDGVDLYAPHNGYGTPDDLKALVEACHAQGISVLLDVVYNHLGPTGNYLAMYAPYFTDKYCTPWGRALNFDGSHSDQVRQFFIDNAVMWLRDYHFDGLRLDAVHAIHDSSAYTFIEELGRAVRRLEKSLARPLVLIAENDRNDPRFIQPRCCGGFGLDAQWNDDFHHALHAFLTGEQSGYYADFGPLWQIAKALTRGYVYDGLYSVFRGRRHGRRLESLEPWRLIGYAQNHDQVGNRAKGDRLSALVSPGKLKIAAALVLTAPFVPLIFQGEEWAASSPFAFFSGHEEPELAEAVRKGRRREFASFGWKPEEIPDPQSEEIFLRSKLIWREKEEGLHKEILQWYADLIALRKSLADLNSGDFPDSVKIDEDSGTLLMRRGKIMLACNFSKFERTFYDLSGSIRLTSDSAGRMAAKELLLPAESAAILDLSGG